MLLLVIDSELDQFERGRGERRHCPLERLVDMGPVVAYLIERRPAEHPAMGPRMSGAFRLVVAVEQEGVAFVERPVARDMVSQDEGLEEPGRMGKMPLCRGGVGERLDCRVRIAERRGEVERQLTRCEQALRETFGGL